MVDWNCKGHTVTQYYADEFWHRFFQENGNMQPAAGPSGQSMAGPSHGTQEFYMDEDEDEGLQGRVTQGYQDK